MEYSRAYSYSTRSRILRTYQDELDSRFLNNFSQDVFLFAFQDDSKSRLIKEKRMESVRHQVVGMIAHVSLHFYRK